MWYSDRLLALNPKDVDHFGKASRVDNWMRKSLRLTKQTEQYGLSISAGWNYIFRIQTMLNEKYLKFRPLNFSVPRYITNQQ